MVVMMTSTTTKIEKLRKKFPDLSPRGLQIRFVRTMKCSRCKAKRMDPGPAQDPWRITCRECGYACRVTNPPKELTW